MKTSTGNFLIGNEPNIPKSSVPYQDSVKSPIIFDHGAHWYVFVTFILVLYTLICSLLEEKPSLHPKAFQIKKIKKLLLKFKHHFIQH